MFYINMISWTHTLDKISNIRLNKSKWKERGDWRMIRIVIRKGM